MASSVSRKVLKALGIFGSVQSIGILCSLVRAKLIALWIGPAGVGLFGIFNSAIDTVSAATQLSLRQSAVRDMATASASERPAIGAAVRFWAITLGLLGAAVMLALSPALSLSSFGSAGRWWMFALLAAVMLTGSAVNGEQAIMQANGQLKQLALCALWGSLAGTAVSVPLYYLLGESGVVPSLLAFGAASLVATLAAKRMRTPRCPLRQNIAIGRHFLSLGIYLSLSSFAALAAGYAFKSYLSNSVSIDEAGLYQMGYTLIISYVGIIFTAIGTEFYPRLASVAARGGMASRIVSHEVSLLLCVLAPVVVVFVCADELCIRLLYSPKFMAALPMVHIGIGGALLRALSYCMAFVMIARADGRCFVAVEIASAAIGLALNIVCYNCWGMAGLGISYVLWYAIYALMCAAVYRLRYRLWLSRAAIAALAGSMAIAAAAILLRFIAWWAPLPLLLPCLLLARRTARKGR